MQLIYVYIIVSQFIADEVPNPLFGTSSQFMYRNCYKRSELLTAYNNENPNDPVHKVPEKLDIK